ncbi:TonB-dependent receptor [Brevundimonas sp. SORGH_AS_0993]|uniref:TonB-dependent receptor n=1 Tax=Brevundimonas sp. SORGH_AS_0993 TaxID=3041794 RepID=UPI0027863DD0|nr:TonB-dependent receptor [Brevundimonas sp. SORGH_AS_0993]MDQ1153262.1 iron complex outermembrane receptor protein [Brevundimonas sp. SORGH_AS_0993]
MAQDRLKLLASVAGATLALVTTAQAPTAQAQQTAPVTDVDEIVVTAQLREQKVIEVPFALTAYSGQFLKDLGVQEFDQLSAFVPGFLVQNQSPNNPGFVMRGITSDSGAATAEPRVSVFQDGVSISKSRGSYVELFDLARVEVAKGPQSTLYGRGALIGAVNLVQNRANPGETEAYANIETGSEDYRMVEGALNLPVGDTAGLRLATRLKTRGGSVENLRGGDDFNAIETKAVRLSGAWAPSDALRFDVIANYQNDHASGTSFKSIAYAPADPDTGAVLGGKAPWKGAALTRGGAFDGGKDLGLNREVWGVTGLARIDLNPAWALNSTTAYRQFDNYETFDADGVSLPILTAAEQTHGEQWSQDLRLGFDNGGRLTGFVGAGWFHEDGYQRTPAQFDERLVLAQLAGLLDGSPTTTGDHTLPLAAYPTVARGAMAALLTPLGAGALATSIAANLDPAHIETSTNRSELTSYDVFGDVTYAFTDRFEMSAGLRYTRDDKTTGYASSVERRSALGALLGVQTGAVPAAQVPSFLAALANPNFAVLPANLFPLFGLTAQPTANNGDSSSFDSQDDGVTWRVTARYELTDAANVYANYARGRRPEVVSASGPSAPGGAPRFSPVAAETVDSYEVGAKSALLHGRLRIDGAIFLYNYENFQTTIQQGTQFITTNAGEAKSYGFEGQANFAVASTLDLFATYAYNHSRFENGLYDGNHFRLSPDHAVSVGATWRLPTTGGEIEVQPTYTWQSKVFFDDDNDIPALQTRNFVADLIQDEYQDAYGLLNLRVRYAPQAGNWGIEAFGENILDKKYIKDAGNTGDALGMPTFIAGRPATYGVGFSLRY